MNKKIDQSNKEKKDNIFYDKNPTEFLFEDIALNIVSKEYSLSDIVDEKGIESCLSISSNSKLYRLSITENDSQTDSNFTGNNMNKSQIKKIIVG